MLPRLESNLAEIMISILKEEPVTLEWSSNAVVGVVLAANGYPETPEKGAVISGLEDIDGDTMVFHAGTKLQENQFVTDGGRVLLVASQGESIEAACKEVYKQIDKIQSNGLFYRHDIAHKALKAEQV